MDCNYCGSIESQTILEIDDTLQIVNCKGCGLTWTLPCPGISYDEQVDYFENYLNNEKLFRSFFTPLLSFTREHISAGKLLEIGSSVGFLLEEAMACGFQVEGIELNKKAAEYCANKGIKINNCLLEECQFPDGKFEVVIMSHVLEHIADLKGFLAEINRVLAPSGYIVLSQPTYAGLIAKILKSKWYGWAPRDHVWHFTPKSIGYVLEQSGFNVKGLRRNTMHYPFGHRLRSFCIALIAVTAGLLGMGDQFYVVAQKD